MITKTKITTYRQLINFIKENDLSIEQAKELIRNSLSVLILEDYNTIEDLLIVVSEYWENYGKWGERTIFLENINLDVRD